MIISRVAQRYAEAVFESVPETERAAFMADVKDLKASLSKSRELQMFFVSPVIDRAKKREVVNVLSEGRFGDWMQRVLLLLVDKDREALVSEILEALIALYREAQGIESVAVATAVDLGGTEREEVRAGLEQFAKRNVDIEYSINKDLLGGVVVRIGDTVYDGSVQRQLARLRNRFMSA